MSVDTLFDYLESAEGGKDLDALMAGELDSLDIKRLCMLHGLSNQHDTNRLIRVSAVCYSQQRWIGVQVLD